MVLVTAIPQAGAELETVRSDLGIGADLAGFGAAARYKLFTALTGKPLLLDDGDTQAIGHLSCVTCGRLLNGCQPRALCQA